MVLAKKTGKYSFSSPFLALAFLCAASMLGGPLSAQSAQAKKASSICHQVADVVKQQLPTVPAKDLAQLRAACRKPSLSTRHKAKLVTLWLTQRVHPSARLMSDRDPSYWLYNDLVGFRQGPAPKAYLSFWPQRRGSASYVRYTFASATAAKSPLKIGDQVIVAGGQPAPVYFVAKPAVKGSYQRMPQQKRPLLNPYRPVTFAEALAQLTITSAGIMPVGSTRIEYLQFFDVAHPKADQLLTQILLSPNPSADKTLIDLRGPTGSVQTELANLLPTHHKKIGANVKKRATYVLVDRDTQGFKQILARFLQNKGAIIMGEPQTTLPGFARFFPMAQSPSHYLLQLPKESKIYQGIKAPTIDSPLPAHLPFSNGVDTMLEQALAILK